MCPPLSREAAWILGLIWSDGNLSGNTVCIVSVDRAMLVKAQTILRGTDLVRLIGSTASLTAARPQWRLMFTRTDTADYLRSMGLTPCKSLTVRWPEPRTFRGPDPAGAEAAFVRGVFDGDGSFAWRTRGPRPLATFVIFTASRAFSHALHRAVAGMTVPESTRFSRGSDAALERARHRARYEDDATRTTMYRVCVHRNDALLQLFHTLYDAHPGVEAACLARKHISFRHFVERRRAIPPPPPPTAPAPPAKIRTTTVRRHDESGDESGGESGGEPGHRSRPRRKRARYQ